MQPWWALFKNLKKKYLTKLLNGSVWKNGVNVWTKMEIYEKV